MNILFCKWGSLIEPKIKIAFQSTGNCVVEFNKEYSHLDYDMDYIEALVNYIQKNSQIDCIFSINFIPIVSRACKLLRLPYLSWTFDSPCLTLYSKTVDEKHNYIFIFDKTYAYKLASRYANANIFYLPSCHDAHLSVSTKLTNEDHKKYDCDISFVGTMYTQQDEYNNIYDKISLYHKGYLDAIINAQQNVYGYNFMQDALPINIVNEIKEQVNWSDQPDYFDRFHELLPNYYMSYHCTAKNRINIMNAISERFNIDLYTTSDTSSMPKVNAKGTIDPVYELPKLQQCSKINLEIVLRSIESALTVRSYSTMGVGGFVLASYQPEIAELFEIGKDIVVYDSIPDLLNKINYYLKHDDERKQIALNGQAKVLKYHTYDIRVTQMLEAVFNI